MERSNGHNGGERAGAASEQAAAWLVRMAERPLPEPERHRFETWLAADPAHRAAFEDARNTWEALALLRAEAGPLREPVPMPHRPVRRITAALAATLLLALGGTAFWHGDPWLLVVADERTAPAEMRVVTLPDGSVLDLGPDSAIALHFDERQRRVTLLRGTVHVAAVPREAAGGRPFAVEAANGTATALGTRFAVERTADAVTVAVAEHRVGVTVAGGVARAELDAGQGVRYDRTGRLGPVAAMDADRMTAWRNGLLVFDRQPLAVVVEELNRYRRGRIVVADAALARRTVSGVFRTAEADDALASITRELGIRSLSIPPFATLLY